MISRLIPATSPRVRTVLAELGQTEDVAFSPSNKRLAIAGFVKNVIVVLDVEVAPGSPPRVAFAGGIQLTSPVLTRPHGIAFIDDDTLIAANRRGSADVFTLPPGRPDVPTAQVMPDGSLTRQANLLDAPGSVHLVRADADMADVLICNNNGNYVSRHRVPRRGDSGVAKDEILLKKHLDIPDGVTVSPDGTLLAVSVHNSRYGLVYEISGINDADSEPVAVLRGVRYPHGVRFTADNQHVFLADAAAPLLRVYAKPAAGWRGVLTPTASIRIMSDDTFARGNYDIGEGGPKGIDIDRTSSVLAVTSECLDVALFDLAEVIGRASSPEAARAQAADNVQYELWLAEENTAFAARAQKAKETVAYMYNSRSWKMTAPLRWLDSRFRS